MTAPHPTTKRWCEVPAPVCVHSSVQPMTPEEIKIMVDLLAARRGWFIRLIEAYNDPLEARAREIEEALNDPFIDKATAFALLDELAEIEVALCKS